MLWLAAAMGPHDAAAADPVTVHVKSGRAFTGWIDPRTDDQRLWVRSQELSITIRRPVMWDVVEQVDAGTRTLSRNEFRADVDTWKTAAPEPPAYAPSASPPPMPAELAPAANPPSAPFSAPLPMAIPPQAGAGIPTSIQMDAMLANWTSNVDTSGLLMSVIAIDDYGQVVPVSGTLDVELIGQGLGIVSNSRSFVNLGRWTRQVTPYDLGPNGNIYRLEFQALHPEFDAGIRPYALVHAKLSVPGAGVFETSLSPTRIRPYDSVRDNLQQAVNTRFFANEQTSRGKRTYNITRGR